jgi:CheY-like chemotaxis protein
MMAEMLPQKAPVDPATPQSCILLADDNEINREIACALLKAAGHEVDAVANGAEAVSAVQTRDYDIVLMDIQMPIMDGVVATRQIRALQHPARIVPIIAMTASVLPQQISSYFDAGMNGHVGKPFKRDELYSAVARWSRRVRAEAQVTAHLDASVFESVVSLLGREKTGVLLGRLSQQLEQFAEGVADGESHTRIARDAHAMISAAGLLGFSHLSDLCRQIEAECVSGADLSPSLACMAELRRAVLAEMAVLKTALQGPA